jgi:hypothetical protein
MDRNRQQADRQEKYSLYFELFNRKMRQYDVAEKYVQYG